MRYMVTYHCDALSLMPPCFTVPFLHGTIAAGLPAKVLPFDVGDIQKRRKLLGGASTGSEGRVGELQLEPWKEQWRSNGKKTALLFFCFFFGFWIFLTWNAACRLRRQRRQWVCGPRPGDPGATAGNIWLKWNEIRWVWHGYAWIMGHNTGCHVVKLYIYIYVNYLHSMH